MVIHGGTMTEQERDLGRRWFEEVWNKGRREAIAQMLSPDSVVHEGGMDTAGPDGFYPYYDRLSATFSEIHFDIDDSLANDDTTCVRWVFTAKHSGEGLGIDPTGVKISVTGITVLRVGGGKLLEGWQNWDMLGLMEQLQGQHKAATYIAVPMQSATAMN
jgi:predicted ester cyclase